MQTPASTQCPSPSHRIMPPSSTLALLTLVALLLSARSRARDRDGGDRAGRESARVASPVEARYEELPSDAFEPSAAPSEEWPPEWTAEPSATPEGGDREYPCRAGFKLDKQYRVYPRFKYVCIRPDRVDAAVAPARCPDGFYLENLVCVKSSDRCDFLPRPPPCFTPPCARGTTVFLQKILTCVVCPDGYQTYFQAGAYKCYKLLQERPRCPRGEKFDKDAGVCDEK